MTPTQQGIISGRCSQEGLNGQITLYVCGIRERLKVDLRSNEQGNIKRDLKETI